MQNEIIVNAGPGETRVAILERSAFSELHLERERVRSVVGNVVKGRVSRVLPGMQAAFVDIGLEKAAFLYVGDYFKEPTANSGDDGSKSGNGKAGNGKPHTRCRRDVPEHTPGTALGRRKRDEADGKHHDGPAERATRIPCCRPATDSDHQADQHTGVVICPDGNVTADVVEIELLRDRPVQHPRDPAENQSEHGADQRIRNCRQRA